MKRELLLASSLLWLSTNVAAQVVPSVEIADPALRAMQQQAMPRLTQVAQKVQAYHFDHNFYCTRRLDIDEGKQKGTDQHSIRFERFEGMTVLAISGNYYGAYSADHFDAEQRARRTFFSVVVPLAKASVPVFANDQNVQGFAFEISHHVIAKVMGEPVERPENLMVYIPRTAAIQLVGAQNRNTQQAALLDSEIYVNANPIKLWLSDGQSEAFAEATDKDVVAGASAPLSVTKKTNARETSDAPPLTLATASRSADVSPPESLMRNSAVGATVLSPGPLSSASSIARTAHDMSPAGLAAIQEADQAINDRLTRELGKQAHLSPLAPPTFIAFHKGIYLDLSLDTRIAEGQSASRYKLAALAFDDHISALIRQVLLYFPEHQEFDGIDFSATIALESRNGVQPVRKPISVEFFLPLTALRSYEAYDSTGQQLLDSGIILINGERVGLNLQEAESGGRF